MPFMINPRKSTFLHISGTPLFLWSARLKQSPSGWQHLRMAATALRPFGGHDAMVMWEAHWNPISGMEWDIGTVGTGLDSKFSFLACQGPAKGPLTWDFSQQCCNVPARFERCYEEPLADLAAMSVMVDPTATMRKHETTILGAYPIVSWREGRITGRNSAETMVTVYVFFLGLQPIHLT